MSNRGKPFLALIVFFAGQFNLACPAAPAEPNRSKSERAAASPILADFDRGFEFAYGSFEGKIDVAGGVARVRADKGSGGAGVNVTIDLGRFADFTPAIVLKAGPANKAAQIKLLVSDAAGKRRMFAFSLGDAAGDEFSTIVADDSLALAHDVLEEDQAGFDPARITQFQVQGDWKSDPVDVVIDRIELVPPSEEMKSARIAYAERLAKKAERASREALERQRAKEEALANPRHPDDGPQVVHVGAAAPDILGITIQAGELRRSSQQPYTPRPDDEIEEKGEPVLAWDHGRIVDVKKERYVLRPGAEGRKKERLGALVTNEGLIWPEPEIMGEPISEATVEEPRAYRISSPDDPAYTGPAFPEAVYRKSKPTEQARGQMAVEHCVYLKLAGPLRPGAEYTIELVGINTRQASVSYRHDPQRQRSEAVHVTQIGYRPSDPTKRAYLSMWLGTGGPVQYAAERFQLIDDRSGRPLYEGRVELGLAADQPEQLKEKKNHTQTNVYFLDFADFDRPGTYRVLVPGIGTSYPFVIGEEVWADAFTVSMHGFLTHRSGIELGPPLTAYRRPRPMHPADGVRVFEVDVPFWDGESDAIHADLRRQLGESLDPAKLREYPDAWGGYMDAGDWDRRSQHLTASYMHLELADLFPDFFQRLKLSLPSDESANRLPDVIDEALWNIDFYRRLQRDHGGVGGGVESTSHPRPGETSWQESLLLGTFAPDPETSYRYAACSAKAARLVAPYDAELAGGYRSSGERAWRWAEENAEREIAAARSRGSKRAERLQGDVRDVRALAAVELYRLTGDRAYHDVFQKATDLNGEGVPDRQLDSIFAYAILPDQLADPSLRAAARRAIVGLADSALEFARGNAFSLTTHIPGLPMIGYVGYYSVPEMTTGPVHPRAHFLTGDEKYLAGAVAATQFAAGANPMNMTMTKGVGHDYPRAPLHVDSRYSGQEAPDGITVYGPGDPSASSSAVDWAHTWYLGKSMVPASRTWPTAEFYVDLSNWPAMTEYTVHQTFRSTSYYWGYLAARPSP